MTSKKFNTALFEKYSPMLHKLSHQCASRCGRPEEDAFGEASELFMLAVCEYDEERGAAFGTYLYSVAKNGLGDWGKKNDLPPDPELLPEPIAAMPDPCKVLMVKEWLMNLSDECKEVASIILNGPAEVLDLTTMNTTKAVRGALYKHLRDIGWSWPKIWSTFQEMKKEVATL